MHCKLLRLFEAVIKKTKPHPTDGVSFLAEKEGFACIFCVAENRGSHQCLHWWQQHATGMLHLGHSNPSLEEKITPHPFG